MHDENEAAQAEGEALPEPRHSRPQGGAVAAVERWYAQHYHAAALAGTAPLSADDKAALIQHVADAVAPPATQE